MLTERHIQRLSSIRSIGDLLDFLREDLGWPITEADPESVTFTFTADELGLKEEHVPKINAIYQIRPLTGDQPWGIFFIDFENKKLPVTLMRRILNALVVKKRGISRTGIGWDAGDLLFMTTYGEEAEGMREVAFAHFHQQAGDLPTLNVLQWDALDAPAKLKTTYDSLRAHLGWPPDPSDKDAWRESWRKPFKHRVGHVIKTAKGLAEELAELSKRIRDACMTHLDAEQETGQLNKLYNAFKEALIHDLKPVDFADTFAQTVSYGLLSAAFSRTDWLAGRHGTAITVEDLGRLVPDTNPFLKEILATFLDVGGRKGGIDFDILGVQDVVELLRGDETDLPAVRDDFMNRKPGEDPVIHFYETYLAAYNREQKVKRGVFYTPQPVVSYIVRSVHELLQTEFGIEDGLASTITWGEMAARPTSPLEGEVGKRSEPGEGSLQATQPGLDGLTAQPALGDSGTANRQPPTANTITIPSTRKADDPFVVILDPATGTATFLVEVIDVIHKHLQNKWQTNRDACIALLRNPTLQQADTPTFEAFWNAYVPDHLLPRVYGYELMMAPYAIAHMKVGLKLGETGYRFGSSQRVRIYLTNALEPASELQARLALDWEALAHEAMAVKAVKETQRFTVVIGNPPYSGHSANASKDEKGNRNFIGNLVHDYYFVDGVPLGEKNPKWLQDDYVKFLRSGQYLIQQTGVGALGMITNHGYLDNPTFRGMRRSLMQSFDELRFLDLHGNSKKKEVAPDGSKDENVFDIMQGVAVCLLVDHGEPTSLHGGHVAHADLYGTRLDKYAKLSAMQPQVAERVELLPTKPFYLFAPQEQAMRTEYEAGWSVQSIFLIKGVGITSARDGYVIDLDREQLVKRAEDFRNAVGSDKQVCEQLGIPLKKGWNVTTARRMIQRENDLDTLVEPLFYRPFDKRLLFYHDSLVWRTVRQVMRHMLARENVGFHVVRQTSTPGWCHVLATNGVTDSDYVSNLTSERGYLHPLYRYPAEKEAAMGIGKEPNLSPAFLDALAGAIGRRFEPGGFPTGRDSETSAGLGGLFPDQIGTGAEGAGPSTASRKPLTEARESFLEHRYPFPEGGESFPEGAESFAGGAEPFTEGGESLPGGREPFPGGSESFPGARASSPGAGEPLPGDSFSPEDVFHYIYAVLHSPAYRSRYAEFLKIDFPRIPLPGSSALFDDLVPLGAELVALHLMESPRLDRHMTTFSPPRLFDSGQKGEGAGGEGSGQRVEKVTYSNNTIWLDKAQTIGFQGVPEEVWNFHIGGYQVCEKWLKDRGPKKGKPGRILSPEDIHHYHRIVVALSETIRIMKEIDIAIESHGGWPDAFQSGDEA